MEVLPISQANGDNIHLTQETADPILVLEHIARLIESNLGAARRELEEVGNLLSKSNYSQTLERCSWFATEPQVALFAQKDIRTGEINGYSQDDETKSESIDSTGDYTNESAAIEHSYSLSNEFISRPNTVASIAFLKRPAPLDAHRPVASQIYPVNLPGTHSLDHGDNQAESEKSSAFEILHTIIHNALGPYFDAHTKSQDPAGRSWYETDTKTGVPGAKRRMQELKNIFYHVVHW